MIAPTPRAGPSLRLSPHVRACQCDGQVVLLDLRRNRYLGLGGASHAALAGAVEGWPSPTGAEWPPPAPADVARLTGPLLAQGLLTQLAGPSVSPIDLGRPDSSLNALDALDAAGIGTRRICSFLASAATTAWWMKCRSMYWMAQTLARRRRQRPVNSATPSRPALREMVSSYERLRPWVYTSRDQCLYDSLALINFLAREDMLARWVVGVKTQPFAAHSWVQSGGTVLNDQHERVAAYRPILVE
jgi:Transglutaminase-like superfamily